MIEGTEKLRLRNGHFVIRVITRNPRPDMVRGFVYIRSWIPDDHHLEGLSYSSVLVKSWLGRFVRVAGIFQVWTEFLFYFLTDYLVDPRGQNLRTRWSIFNRQVASHQIIVKSVVVVVSSGATSVSKCVRGRVKSSFLLNLISFGIFVRFSH